VSDLTAWLQQMSSIVRDLFAWLLPLFMILLALSPYILFSLYSLLAIDWKKMGPTLREGAWLPLVLLLVLIALVWSRILPRPLDLFGLIAVGNFWWQLAAVGLLAALGLFCGWVQELYSWAPIEIATEPDPHAHHADDHGHDHHGPAHDHQPPPVKEDPLRKHTASHDRGVDRGGEG